MGAEARHPLLFKAIRIVLVFTLVFFSSLGVEWAVAFGADGDAPGVAADTQQQDQTPTSGSGSTSGTTPSSPASDPAPTEPSGPSAEEQQHEADVAAAQAVVEAIASLRGATADDRARVDAVQARLASLTAAQQALVPDEAKQELQEISKRVDQLIAERDAEGASFTEEERFVASKHAAGTLVDIQAWSLDPDDASAEYASALVRSVRQTAEEKGYQTPKMSTLDGSLQVVAVPMWQSDTDLEADWKPKALKADFLKWTVVGNDGYADVTTDGGVLTVHSKAEGSFVVTCAVDNGKNEKGEQVGTDYTNLVYGGFGDDYPGKDFALVFSVEVLGPYVDIELLQSDGTTCAGLESLSLTAEQLKSYEFQANVRVYDQVHEGAIDEFLCTKAQSLSQASAAKYGDMFEDLTWQVLDADREPVDESLAKITEGGVLSFTGDIDKDGPIIVRASSPNGFNQNLASAEVRIGNWKEDPQGESHPQDTLRIVSNAKVAETPGDNTGEGGSGVAEAPDAEPSDGEQPANPSSEQSGGVVPDAPAENDDTVPREGPLVNDDVDDEGSASEYAIDKIYTVAQIEALGKSVETFTMQDSDGLMTVKGEGVDLALLLADAGITDTSQITSIDFIDYTGASTSVTWADISSGTQAPFIAVRSRVLTDGTASGAASDPDAEENAPAGSELLDNTRFRLLFYGSASVDPDALRWIKQIRVNVGTGGGEEETDLAVRVDYVPVPRGKQAVLSAIPNQAIGNARFGFTWETSADGKTWETVPDGAVQTLRLMTDDEHIGRWYRVVLETDRTSAVTGEPLSVTSKPVQITEGSGFMAILAYDPPIAGQTAIFQSSVEAFVDGHQISIDPAQLKYEWQKSEDGGATWQRIEGATGPSFAVPTEPVAEEPAASTKDSEGDTTDGEGGADEGAQEPEPVTLVYVRVVVTTTDTRIPEQNRIAESNAQPLTVRVGGGDDPAADNAGTNDDVDQQGSAEHLPTNDPTSTDQVTPNPVPTPTPAGSVTEISNIHVDNTPRPTVTPTPNPVTPQEPAQTQAPATAAPANSQELKPDELLINPEITALVQAQEAAVDKAVTDSRPGARWTQLSTIEPTDEDVRRILSENPFAPFAIPLGLGIAAAGGLEKLLAYRRQID